MARLLESQGGSASPHSAAERWKDLRVLRKNCGICLNSLAALIGVSPRTVLNWENGQPPKNRHIAEYMQALGKDPREIFRFYPELARAVRAKAA